MSFMIDFEQYSVIGDPVYHSLSPFLHKIIFDYFNEKNKIYSKLKITCDGLVYNFSLLKSNFKGFNVTAPHKINIIKYLDELDDFSKKVGSVNTVKILNGKSFGYNTDSYGFLKGLKDFKDKIKGKNILVFGSGATSRVVINVLIDLEANITVVARDFEKLMDLKQFICDTCGGYNIDILSLDKVQGDYFGIVNTTSALSNFNISNLRVSDFVYDVNYDKDGVTDFLYRFLNMDVDVIDGRDMLFYQAIKSQEIWRDEIIKEEDVLNIYSEFKKVFLEE